MNPMSTINQQALRPPIGPSSADNIPSAVALAICLRSRLAKVANRVDSGTSGVDVGGNDGGNIGSIAPFGVVGIETGPLGVAGIDIGPFGVVIGIDIGPFGIAGTDIEDSNGSGGVVVAAAAAAAAGAVDIQNSGDDSGCSGNGNSGDDVEAVAPGSDSGDATDADHQDVGHWGHWANGDCSCDWNDSDNSS